MSKRLGAFVVGGLVGAAVALLYAPRTGAETRAMVSERVGSAWGEAQEFGAQAQVNAQQAYQTAVARGQVVAQNVASRGQEFYGQAQTRVQEAADAVKPVITDTNDQLRDKIEAARQRIAAQVARNAEESIDAAEPVDAADPVEAVEPVQAAEQASAAEPAQADAAEDPRN